MRLTYIVAVVVAATLHTSVAAFSSVKYSKAAIENGALAAIVDSAEGGRLLRRVDNNYDDLDDLEDLEDDEDDEDDLDNLTDDDFDEERGLGDVVKKINPFKTVSAEAAKARQALKEGAAYQSMIEKANKMVYKSK
ncbi:hypothetical protein P3T76_007106 [Phytophthora citrophthora]|uniref:RxLR effector protein n=1 Tax=Phytophthora citrophthora TaxID=4793 RepID=A0AAD9LLN2_9STRA|nr:hypothetical protein P3T76_007106 [Phytophthora citrophthora]